jgi:hypothetical protein
MKMKSEDRNPKSERNPKAEGRTGLAGTSRLIRIWDCDTPRKNEDAGILSLAPGFSRVTLRVISKPFQRLPRALRKPLKRLNCPFGQDIRLKPGVNEKSSFLWSNFS